MYATQQDLIDRFGETEVAQLSDRTTNGAAIDPVVVASKLADADAEIDAYLQAKYTLPLAVVPPVLARIACDIARYHLYDDRATDQVTARYKDAIRFLENLAKGAVSLGTDPSTTPASSGAPEHFTGTPVFNRDTLKDFVG